MEAKGCTCFREVPQGAAQGAPLQALPHGVGVVQAGPVHGAVAGLLLQAGALGHAGPHHALLLLQLSYRQQKKVLRSWDMQKHLTAKSLTDHLKKHLLTL